MKLNNKMLTLIKLKIQIKTKILRCNKHKIMFKLKQKLNKFNKKLNNS
jgi:hypothetical protein